MKNYKLLPDFETEVKGGMFNCIVKIENDYLQAWADAGAYVMLSGKEDYWIMTGMGHLWFKIKEDCMHLECIAVLSKERKQGKGGALMKLVTDLADETETIVSLEVSDVTQGGYVGMAHPVVGHGQVKKDKIPVRSLPAWYAKKGFFKAPNYTLKNKGMYYTPQYK